VASAGFPRALWVACEGQRRLADQAAEARHITAHLGTFCFSAHVEQRFFLTQLQVSITPPGRSRPVAHGVVSVHPQTSHTQAEVPTKMGGSRLLIFLRLLIGFNLATSDFSHKFNSCFTVFCVIIA